MSGGVYYLAERRKLGRKLKPMRMSVGGVRVTVPKTCRKWFEDLRAAKEAHRKVCALIRQKEMGCA